MAGASERREERVKLAATFLSNAGLASIVAGLVGPTFTGRFAPGVAVLGFMIGASLHLVAQRVLHYVVATDPAEGQ